MNNREEGTLMQLQLYKNCKLFILISVLLLSQGCTPDEPISKPQNALFCGDFFTKYADKPSKLHFVKCTTGQGQTLFDAEYVVSSEDSQEVENILVKQYGLMKFSDYYHSMPMNEVFLEPVSLKKIDPDYHLLIIINNDNFESLLIDSKTKNEGFTVNVKIMVI